MTAVVTYEQLRAHHACARQLEKFLEIAPNGSVVVTAAKAKKYANVFHWGWAARLLDALARAEYERACEPARAQYESERGAAWAKYESNRSPAQAEYDRVHGPAWAEYRHVRSPAWAEYERACGPAWALAYRAACKRAQVSA